MSTESRPGRRVGKPLSHLRWRAKKGALERTHEGTLNEILVEAFALPTRPIDVLHVLVAKYLAANWPCPKSASPANYVRMRLYELKRRNVLVVHGA